MSITKLYFYAGETKEQVSITMSGTETISDAQFVFEIKRTASTEAIVSIEDDDFDKTYLTSDRKLLCDIDIPEDAHGNYYGFLTITMADGGIKKRPKPPSKILIEITQWEDE